MTYPLLTRIFSIVRRARRGATLALFFSLAALCACGFAAAAPDDEEAAPVPDSPQDIFDQFNFDNWAYQGVGSKEGAQQRIDALLAMQINELNHACGLTDEQRTKLQLAALGDTKRYFEHVEEVRVEFEALRKDQNAFGQIWPKLQALQSKLNADFFARDSLFAKTLRKSLSAEQIARYEEVQRQRRQFLYRASVEVTMQSLATSVPLLNDQREAITKLLLEESSPPEKFGQYDTIYVIQQLARLPAEKVKPLVDPRQMTRLELHFQNYRDFDLRQVEEAGLK